MTIHNFSDRMEEDPINPVDKLRIEINKCKEEFNEQVEHLEFYTQQVQATRDRMAILLGRIQQYETALEVIKNGKFG